MRWRVRVLFHQSKTRERTQIMNRASKVLMAGVVAWLLAVTTRGAEEEGWISLFDGRTLSGWKSSSDNPSAFSIEDGAIKVNGERAHLFYVGDVNHGAFDDFEFKAQVKTLKNSNSGIYFHTKYQDEGWPETGYEAQVNHSHSDWRKTGGLYGVKDVRNPPSKDDEWFEYYIKVEGRHVIVKINGEPVVDYTQPEKPEHARAFPGRMLGKGTFCLQAHDPGSTVFFRDIFVKPLK
jgi:hypothetical protein